MLLIVVVVAVIDVRPLSLSRELLSRRILLQILLGGYPLSEMG